MQAAVVLSCFVLCQLVAASPFEDIFPNEANTLEKHPSLGELFKRLSGHGERWKRDVNSGETSDTVCYVDEEAEKIKEMLRYLDKNRNQLSKVLEDSSCGSDQEETSDRSLHPQKRWIELQSALLQLLSPEEPSRQNPKPLLADFAKVLLSGDLYADPPYASLRLPADSGSREECYIDYAGFVEPITDRIMAGVLDGLCKNISIFDFLPDGLERLLCEKYTEEEADALRNTSMPDWGGRSRYFFRIVNCLFNFMQFPAVGYNFLD